MVRPGRLPVDYVLYYSVLYYINNIAYVKPFQEHASTQLLIEQPAIGLRCYPRYNEAVVCRER